MPWAPRFTQKPSIQQTASGDLLMECLLEADPPPDVRWQHAGTPISASSRVQLTLNKVSGNLYRANLVIKEPSASDGGAYKCTASNQFGESNANINLNFAGGDEPKPKDPARGPTFVGKPRIMPRDGGALILMECKVKSPTRPQAKWSKDGVPLQMGALYQDVFADLGDGTFLCQLEIRRPTAGEAGQYRCNIKNEQGETNANLKLDFQQEEAPSEGSRRSKTPSRPGTPSSKKHREGTPGEKRERRHKSKSREGSPRKHIRSRTATPTQEVEGGLKPPGAEGSREPTPKKSRKTLESGDKEGLPPAPKGEKSRRSRSKSPAVPAMQGPEGHKRAPVVTEPLKSRIAHTGERVQLQCELQCHSSTKINWSKDGKTVISSTSSGYSASFDGKIAKLEILKMSEQKSGLYKCAATSNYGETQTSAMVKWEQSEEEKKAEMSKMEVDEAKGAQKRRKSATKKDEGEGDQVVPEKRVQIHSPSPSIDGSKTPERRGSSRPGTVSQPEDGIPGSGLKIPPERRKELIRMSGGGEESEDEMTESISEKPQKKDAKKHSVTIKEPEKKASQEANGGPPTMVQVGRKREAGDMKEEFRQQNKEEKSPTPQPSPEKRKSSSLRQLEGLQVGKKRPQHEFQGIQLKRVPKKKEEEKKDEMEKPDLKHRGSQAKSPSIPREEESIRKDSLHPDRATMAKETTELEQYERRASMRRRSSVDMRRESVAEVLEKPSVPLKDKGSKGTPARIVEIPENVTVVENEIAIFKCLVEGNPAPKFTWKKGGREVPLTGRVRCITDGDTGQISLVISKCRPQDEGEYTLEVKNSHGTDTVGAKLLVTSGLESNLDFRTTLKKRDTSISDKLKSESEDRPKSEADRRASIFGGKREERWVEPLPDKIRFQQQVDKIAQLKCVYSRPNAKVRWMKDRKEVFSGGLKYKILIDKQAITLVINNPDPDDSGKYTCEANGVATHSMVTVDEPPMKYVFLNPLPNTMEIYRTKQGILTCKLNSAKAPLVWHRGGKAIDPDDPRYIIEKDTTGRFTLTIRVVEQVDQSEWTAFVSNDVKSKCTVYVEEPRDTFVVPLKSQRANERENATFECDTNDKDIDVEWFHDGAKIKMDGVHFKEEKVGRKRRLIITGVRIEDHGEYKCTTKDDKTMAQLIVDPLNKFIVKLEDQEVFEKEDVNLRCETKDTRTPGQWFRNGKPISSMPGSKYECISRSGVHTMKISKIEMNEGDRYEIDVAGLKGACRVTVLEAERKPVINWKPQKIECEAGKEKRVKVPFQVKGTRRGDPKPVLMKNGKPVDLNKMKDLVEVVINGDVAEIIFKNPSKTDTGKWALKLENTGGESAPAQFDLFVKDKPKMPKGPLEVSDITAETCKLKWKPADHDEQAPTRGYVVEMQDGRGGPWKKIGETKGTDFAVNGLKEHGEYKFRVKAVNEIGESEPLIGETILAKNPYTVPGKPRNMQAADIDDHSLTLQWDPPESDGGAPVEAYTVERREKSDKDWNSLGQVPAQGAGKHQMVDDKVVEGKEYYYRVRAVNKAGPGDPCDHGKPFKIQAKPAKPDFTSGGIQDQRLKVGETIKYEIGIAGAPLPEVSWTVNGKPLKPGGRVKMTTEKGKTVLKIEDAQRSDSGRFCIKLKNKSGECQSEATVTVVGRPDPPRGPLEVGDICKDGAKLAWKPPADDGGEPLTGYVVEAQDADEGGKFVPVGQCGPDQIELKVKGLKEKGNYKFRVKAVNKEGESEPLGTDKIYQIKDPWDEPGKPGRPQITDVDKDKVSLAWDPPMKDGGAPIEQYLIEMRDPKGKDWVQVATSEKPEATVTGLQEGKEYQFRVKAKNKAGPGQPSEPCEKVVTEPKFVPAWLDHDGMKNLVVRAGQTAKWTVKFNGKPAPDVFWFKNDQPITDLSGAMQIDVKKNDHTILCIPAAVRADRGQYSLKVKNPTGEDSVGADLTVLDKPGKPKGPLDVSNVTEDGCELGWRPPDDDGGVPIEYYEVEKLDADTGKWVPCAKVTDCHAAVKGLQKGKQYQFRVKAVNKEGQSEPLIGDQSILAKNPYDEPGKCGAPDIVDWDANSAQLAWDPPKSDGGAPIEDYIVEKKSKHDRDWKECARVGAPTPSMTVKGLKEGEEYEFRVRAVNKAGPGEPSDPSKKMIAKARHQKPKIDRSAMQPITIKVGQSLDFKVPVTGEPPPEKVWSINGKPVTDDGKLRVTNEDYKTNLALRNATREHAGTYKLVASNDSGTDEYEVKVQVLGKPSAPEGPLEVSDVFEDRATLDWKAPADDGGMPIDHYEVEKMDVATGRWLPCGRCTEPHMTVENLQPGHQYQFRVRAVNKEGESDPLVTKDPTLAKNPFDVPGKMDKPEVTDWDKDHVDLAWKPPANDGGAPVEEYLIEKKDATTGKWQEALRVPAVQTNATVPGLRPGEEYQFRISAKNRGGLGEPSDPTQPVTAKPRNLAPRIHREDLSDQSVRVGQDVKFNVHIDGEPPPTVTWTFEGGPLPDCVQVQNPDYLSKFALVKPTRAQSGKYTITATNPNGTDSVTVQIAVKSRPSPPKGPLEVSDVFENKMTLDWKPPEDDGGEPISHYEVERQDGRDGIWVPCGSSAEPHMVVDGLSKGANYKFRVKAVNSEGKSDPLESDKAIQAKNPYERPDKPNAPELVDWDADHVDLKWEPPKSDGGAPIEQYVVEKRSKYGRWEPSGLTTDGQTTAGTVGGLTKGEEYEFRVTAVNKGGPSEPSDPSRSVIAKPRNVPPKIGELKPLKLHAGQMINFDVPVEGEPLPNVTWFGPDGNELRSAGQKVRVEHDEEQGRAKLQIKGTDRSHSGEYVIRAVNPNGEAEQRVRVDVLDKPSAPEGPLNVSDIHADRCTLDWKPPLDDGGAPIENYVVEKLDSSTGRWVKAGKTAGPECKFTVDGLTPGHDYKFRVAAVNAEGESEPLETDHKITAKEPFDPPGKPGKPELTDWDKEHAEMKWTPPTDDGGAPIEEYVVEMRDKFSPQWKQVAVVPADASPHASIGGLTEGEEYEYRVVAKNKAGKGQPSDPSNAIVAKDRNVPPKIDRSSIHEIRVRAGQPFQLDIPISGEPPPEITWDFEGKPLESDDRMKIVCNEKGTKFTVKRALRSDTGVFNITAKNDNGTDKAEVHVTVLDRPSEPRGPLNIGNVHKTGCTLDWKPPEDDGGAAVSHYVVEKLDLATGRWTAAGESTDCKMDVTDLTPGHEYRFRVKAVNKYGESDPLEAQKSVVAKDPFDTADRPGTPDIVDWDKNWADLKWTPPLDDGGAPVEKYVVEKRMGNGDWEYGTEVPASQTNAKVEGLIEGKQYQFRVKALNKAGESSPSNPSRTLLAKARRLPPKIDRSAMPEIRIKKGGTIEFNVPVEGEPNPKCQWSINGTPLSTSDRTKVDNTNENHTKLRTFDAERMDSGVYKLLATNEHGKDECEVQVTVLDVPSPPGGPLDARDVTKESTTLKWFTPEDDGGSPITHYLVEKQEADGRWCPCGETPETTLRVNRLVEGKEYKFRVKAVNRQGESKPLTGDQSVLAKNPWEKPGKPQDVKVIDWDKDHMDLEWRPPISDGGAPIDGYIIERKPKNGHWLPCGQIQGNVCKGTADGLIPGEEYQFRVKAQNKAGEGEPSDPTEPKVAKPRKMAPKLNLNSLMDIRVRAGQPINICAEFEGEPAPVASWTVNGKPFSGTSHAELDNKEHLSSIIIGAAERSDAGTYGISVKNEHGVDQAQCKVTVLDVPGPPQGPLQAKNIHKEGCTLNWRPPEDDGGAEIIGYVVEKLDTSRGTWQEVGQFPDCEAKVTKLTPGKKYLFRVKAVNVYGESKPLEGDKEIIAKNPFDVPDPPSAPEIIDYDEGRIDIAWKPPANDGGAPIKEYIVERREKGSPNWMEVGHCPSTSFSCTGLRKGQEYEFRVRAVNEAGPSAPSAPSASQMCKTRWLKPQIITQQRKWKVRAGNTLTMDIEFVGAPDPSVGWTKAGVGSLPAELIMDKKPGKTSIFFPHAKRAESGAYELRLKNEVGETEGTFEVIVQDRPGPPKGPMGVENITKDSCQLNWHPPEDDGGSEITNYVLERREVGSGVWTPVSNFVAGCSCTAGKLREGQEYEYRVCAENALGRSDPLVIDSPVLAKDPFGTPGKPGRPEITDHDNHHISLKWTPPNDTGGSPITHYDVQRKDQKTGRWIKVNTHPVYETEYTDERVQPGHGYEYRVVAVNKAGPGKPSDPSDLAFAKPKFEAPRFELDIDGKEVRVRAGQPLDLPIPYVGSPQPEITWTKDGMQMSGVETKPGLTRLYIPQSKRADSGQCRIEATNEYGKAEARVLITVIDRPGPPEGPITYPSTTKRGITLAWKPPKDDGGADLSGYRIEYQELGAHDWERVPEQCTLLSYTVRNLEKGKQYRFRVFAENMAGISEPLNGDPVTAKDPFDPPGAPSTPEVTGYDSNMVALKWNPPRDDGGSPITGYVVERLEKKGGGDWAPVTSLGIVRMPQATVTGLSNGETYQFRVRAVNAAGEGPPSGACEPVECRPFVEPPGAPDKPRIGKVTKHTVDLSWMRPISDGGAPIEGYVVEQRKMGDDEWKRANVGMGPGKMVRDTRCTVEGLPEKEQFEFRVRAVNKAGEGDPSKPSDLVFTTDEPGRPILDLSGLKDITVRAGETITFTLPYSSGGVKPSVDVLNGNQTIFEDERTKMEVDDDKIVFTTIDSKRSDAGPYKVVVQNRHGKDSAKLNVNVLDVPGKPTGPILFSELASDACTLHWSAPKDDGGSPVTNYVVERKPAKGGDSDWEKVGAPAGLSFRSRGLTNGERYDFRVRAENQFGVGAPLDADESLLAKGPFDVPGPPGAPEPLHTAEDSITLQWTKPLHDGGAPILGYVLEKREAGSNDPWERAAFGNVPDTKCKVTGVKPQHTYEFRVAAVNAAGQGEWSENSVPIIAAPRPSRPVISMGMLARDMIAMVGDSVKLLVPYAASPRPEITWTKNGIPLDGRDRAQIESNDFLTQLNYPKCERGDTGTYSIRIENDLGSDSVDLRLKVVDRPSPPEGPLDVDDIGPESCRLAWKTPRDDGGSPITNYVIEKCRLGGGPENWERLSSFVRNTSTLVPGLIENERYKFRVMAENQYGISNPLELPEPIVAKYQFSVPGQPDKPIVRNFDRTWADVEWEPPASNGGSKILGYNLQYRDQHSHKWITAEKALIEGTNFKVQNLRDQGEYEFRVVAKNAAGWSKPSPPSDKIQLRQRFGPPGPPISLHANSIGPNWVTLTWQPPLDDGGCKLAGYVVEKREIGHQQWEMATPETTPLLEFTVPGLREFHDYEFRVFALNSHGRGPPSLPSGPIKIQETAGGKPHIVVKPEDQACPYNKRAIFTCEAVGRPQPKARWLRNGREIPDGARYRVEDNGEGQYKLIIKEVWDIDGGDYSCQVYNVFGSETATAVLKVQAPPVIEKQVPNAVHPAGDMVRIKIFFSGSPPFTHRFTLNGVEVSPDAPNIRWVDFDDHILLTIPELHAHEAGRYEYKVWNESGEASTGFWINVSGLPSVPEGPLQITEIGEHQCTVSWRPPAHDGGSRITNYVLEKRDLGRESAALQAEDQGWVTVASAVRELSFIVAGLFPHHEYDFRVSACNTNGQGPVLNSDSPIVARLPFDPPGPPVLPGVVDVGPEYAILSWQRPEKDGGGRIRGYMVEKCEEGTDIWQKCTQAPSPSNSLNVTNLIDGRKYSFRIMAVNDAGESKPALIEHYDFLPSAKGLAPEIITAIRDQHGTAGGSATFECEIGGSPKPEIQWFRGSKELVDTPKCTLIDKGAKQVCIIANLHAEDEAEYTCRATNQFGTRSTRAQLKLSTKPRLFVPPKYFLGLEVESDRTFEFRIPYKAHPQVTSTWTLLNSNGEEQQLNDGGKYAIQVDDKTVSLRISGCTRADAGEYRILAHNSVGSDSATVKLTVMDKPEAPRFPVVENVLDEAAILSWKPPALDGGALVTNYIVEKRESGGQWQQCARSRFCYLTVEGLKPKASYEFRVVAENKHGLSEPCEPTPSCTIPESRIKRFQYEVDDVGRLIRGKSATPTIRTDEYDSMVVDPWSHFPPQPIQIMQNASIYDEYDVLEEIGTGAFGVVHRLSRRDISVFKFGARCVQKSTGNVFAAKFVPTTGGEMEKETVRKEIETMSELRHPSLLSLHDAFEMDQELVMVYEFMSGGELFEKASSEQNKMSEEESRKYIRQICNGLRHMHEMSYVHLDLKPENIMFSKKTSDQLKLIDFGLATKIDPNREVKVTTGTPEFAAPEVIGAKEIGFYTDMWSVGVLAYILLSGLSPFGGENDEETLENVRKCDWSMEGEPEFEQISEDAKNFIRRLLVADRRQRMTVHQALEHPWLADLRRKEELEAVKIPAERFHRARDNVRNRYDAWAEPLAPIGRISQFSSLRIHQPDRFRIRKAKFDQNDAQPRFVLRPTDGDGREGQPGVSFFCKVLSPTPIRLSWLKDGKELKNGDKYRQQSNVNDYALTVTNLEMEDRGEYSVRAINEYGQRECQMFLNVLSMPKKSPSIRSPTTNEATSESPKSMTISSQSPASLLQIPPLAADSGRRRSWAQIEMPNISVGQQGPPTFSFPLRPRLIQKNHSCKLLCTVTSNPPPKIEWFKEGELVDLHRVQTMYKSGVASLEIFNTRLDDAGIYKCLASNEFGQTECSAPLSVETRHSQWKGGARERRNFDGDQQQKNLLQSNGAAATSSDMGNSRLMAGLVGERREKLVSRVQK